MRLSNLVLALTLLFGTGASADPAAEQARVAASSVHLRRGPGLTHPIMAVLKRGTLLRVVSRQGDWVQVQVADTSESGFVFARLIEVVSEGTAPLVTPLQASTPPPSPGEAAAPSPSPLASQLGSIGGRVTMAAKGGSPAEDLSEAVVYLENAPGNAPVGGAKIEMRGKEFNPHVLAVGVGSRVDFPNVDPILHNVFSPSTSNVFDLGLYMRPDQGNYVFRHPGIVRVYCNIHPQMSAVVLVRDNPFFVKTSRKGLFSLAGVPAGRYTIHAWHEEALKEATATVVVTAGGATSANLALDASSFEQPTHKKKDGKDYAPDAYKQ